MGAVRAQEMEYLNTGEARDRVTLVGCFLGARGKELAAHTLVLQQILYKDSQWNFGEGFWASEPLANDEASSGEVLAASSVPAGYWIPCAALFGVMDVPPQTARSPRGLAARMPGSSTSQPQGAQGVLLCCHRLPLGIKGMAPPARGRPQLYLITN